jgi:hypothetical protein
MVVSLDLFFSRYSKHSHGRAGGNFGGGNRGPKGAAAAQPECKQQ